jgi:triosephosphate isomerase
VRRPPRTSRARLGHPLFLLNLKSYPGTAGRDGLEFARLLERYAARAGVAAAIAPPIPELARVASGVRLPVLAQHVDALSPGAFTGFIVPETVRDAGARGSLVNHSEHRLPRPAIGATVDRLRAAGLVAVVCAGTVAEAAALAALRPPYLAVEPPELIGGEVSVSAAQPEVIARTVAAVHAESPLTHVLCGAGIHDREDVRRALELGADGILVASAVAKAARPGAAIQELLRGFAPR